MEERPLAQRLAAGAALLALLVAGALSAWWIVTDQADFRSLVGRPDVEATAGEGTEDRGAEP
ncbi:MAG: hypothetical protein QNK04_14350 [Myxococcota bacterium]|nr:hypothetical protein [Myxococcota bacterium]